MADGRITEAERHEAEEPGPECPRDGQPVVERHQGLDEVPARQRPEPLGAALARYLTLRAVAAHVQHGRDCPKVPHEGAGYLHEPVDDGPVTVDGLTFCGRCHEAL